MVLKVTEPKHYTMAYMRKQFEAIERVRKLHKPVAGIGITECAVCVDDRMYWVESVEYPCPTIKALDGES